MAGKQISEQQLEVIRPGAWPKVGAQNELRSGREESEEREGEEKPKNNKI